MYAMKSLSSCAQGIFSRLTIHFAVFDRLKSRVLAYVVATENALNISSTNLFLAVSNFFPGEDRVPSGLITTSHKILSTERMFGLEMSLSISLIALCNCHWIFPVFGPKLFFLSSRISIKDLPTSEMNAIFSLRYSIMSSSHLSGPVSVASFAFLPTSGEVVFFSNTVDL